MAGGERGDMEVAGFRLGPGQRRKEGPTVGKARILQGMVGRQGGNEEATGAEEGGGRRVVSMGPGGPSSVCS